jgi:uncharacterized membrane protein YhhN
VNAATGAAFAVAAVFAVGDWTAKARNNRPLEYVCKPATLAALIVAASVLDPTAGAGPRRTWFVVALSFSLVGDILLMLDDWRDLFVFGLGAFLLAHVAYVVGFFTDPPGALAWVVGAVIVIAVLGPVAVRIVRSLGAESELRVPVVAYIVVISVMVATALATGNVAAAIGAVLFASSDAMIAWNRFVRPFPQADVAIMVTYHLGQAGLVLSLLR